MPDIPPTVTPDNVEDAKRFLDDVIAKVTREATPEILQAGEDLLLGLAAIVICWIGLRQAFEGFNSWAWIQAITVIMIPWSILAFYDQPLPLTSYTFPESVAGAGSWAMNVFLRDSFAVGPRELAQFGSKAYDILEQAWSTFNWSSLIFGTVKVLISPLVIATCFLFMVILFIAMWVIVTAQVLWATIAIAVTIMLGPLFIPFLIFEPLAFLFWGWLKTLITYSLYGAVAGAIQRVFMGLGYGYMEGVLNPNLTFGDVANTLLWMVSIIFLMIAGILAAFKVGEISALLVSGSGSTGAGLMSTVATVVTAGKAAVAAKAWAATKAAGAAKAAHGGALPKLY